MKKAAIDNLIMQQEGLDFLRREDIENIQLRLLNMQIERSRAFSGFYRDLSPLSSLEGLKYLPFTTAQDIAENYRGLLLVSPEDIARIRTEYTSGTTGTPKKVAYTMYDCDRTKDFFVCGLSEFIGPGDTTLICMPTSDPLSLGGLVASAVESLGARPITAGVGLTFSRLADIINAEKPDTYVGMPATLLSLFRIMGGDCTIRRALTSGDTTSEFLQSECEKYLKEPLFPHYGLRESGLGMAYTCHAHEGMHIRENDIITEIISQSGTPLPDGEWGEIVITTAGLEAMPLIRYKTGDTGRILPSPCPCGSVTRRLEVRGRMTDGPAVWDYDRAVFSLNGTVDFKLSQNDAIILVSDSKFIDGVRISAKDIFPDRNVTVRSVSPEDGPLYLGKRAISE